MAKPNKKRWPRRTQLWRSIFRLLQLREKVLQRFARRLSKRIRIQPQPNHGDLFSQPGISDECDFQFSLIQLQLVCQQRFEGSQVLDRLHQAIGQRTEAWRQLRQYLVTKKVPIVAKI